MDPATRRFDQLRPRLQGIAYRMLGSNGEAEEVVQDAWLRWHATDPSTLDNAEAWLVAVTTRLAIDRLRSAKLQREQYPGIWLPEPQLSEEPTPEEEVERADSVSVAFLLLLERLTPEARAAFLLREVFDLDYDEVATSLDRSEAACRQLVHRAKTQLREQRSRQVMPRQAQQQLLQRFVAVLGSGDIAAMKAMLAEDAVLLSDGGGKVSSLGKPLVGGEPIAKLYRGTHWRYGAGIRLELAMLNGGWGLLRFIDGALESAQTFEIDGSRITRIQVQRNPDKLARIVAALGR